MTTVEVAEDDYDDVEQPRWWQRWRRHADLEPDDEPDAPGQLIELRKTPVPVVVDEPEPVSKARSLVVQVTGRPWPTRRQMWRSTRWWARQVRDLIPRLPLLLLRELKPIAIGVGKVASGWARWVQCVELAEAVKEAKENERSKASERLAKRRSARAWGSGAVLLVAGGGWWWLHTTEPSVSIGVAVVVAAVFDLIGRRATKPVDKPLAPAMPQVLYEGVPLRQITASILATFVREGFEEDSVRVAQPLRWDEDRREYRIQLSTHDAIKPEHVRAVERAVGAKDYAIRLLGTGTATVRELVIRVGDPLAAPVERPFVPTGSRSITQPVDLGVSMTEVPFAIPFAGVHIRIVAGTGGGKSKWLLRSALDGLSACRDCVLGGIDITNGPELSLWRGVIQYRGTDVEGAERVLDKALAEIERRGKILAAIAEDDDPTNDADEWHAGLGPAFVVVADEFAQLAVFDGKGGKPDLLGKAEQVVRTGRKHWVSLVMLTQRTGNDDFGSTTMSTQCGVSIAGPCDPADTVRMFGVERRDAGYTPHLLSPGVEGDIRDAGKVMIDSPMHRTPDLFRAFAPGSTSEVKRRARQRMADGLPTLDGARSDVLDAVEVPPIVAAVARAFDECDADRLPTTELIEFLAGVGLDATDQQISDAMQIDGARVGDRWRPVPGGPQIRGYTRAAANRKVRSLG